MARCRSLSYLLLLSPPILVPGALAHDGLNVNESNETCDIQFSADLTQGGFARFTREAADIVVHKSGGTAVLSPGELELGIGYSTSPIEQRSEAWNETFHHPNAEHDLGDAIALPMLYGRFGLGRRTDLGAYFSGNPSASYRLAGLGLKRNLFQGASSAPDLAVSLDWGLLFGPDDTTIHALGTDLHASRSWKAITGYAAGGLGWAHGVERSPLVDLQTEDSLTAHWSLGLSPRVWRHVVLDLRARFASVDTFEFRVGHTF